MDKKVRAMKIEKNIPIPSPRIGKYTLLLQEMEEGDSLICKKEEVGAIRVFLSRQKGYKAVGRKQPDGTIRIWKVKKEDKEV